MPVLVMTCEYCCVKTNVKEFVNCVKGEKICYDCFENIPIGEMIYEKTPVAQLIAQKKTELTTKEEQVEEFDIFGFDLFEEEPDYENMSLPEKKWTYEFEKLQLERRDRKQRKRMYRSREPQECSVCFKPTRDRTDCHHTLCYKCASQIRDYEGEDKPFGTYYGTCPICRKRFFVKDKIAYFNYSFSTDYYSEELSKIYTMLKFNW